MNRQQIITELKKYFDIRELVCPHTFKAFGERAWQFFDRDFLETLLIVRRDILKVEMTANNWHKGGIYSQRGFRCNICQLVKDKTLKNLIYLTSHSNGASIDFDAKGLTVDQVHAHIKANAHLLPVPVRMEKGVTWNHLDTYDNGSGLMFSEFEG